MPGSNHADAGHVNVSHTDGNSTRNGVHPELLTSRMLSANPTPSALSAPANLARSASPSSPRRTSRPHSDYPVHEIVPDGLMSNNVNQNRNFLDFPPADMLSAEPNVLRYLGVVKSLGPSEEKWAIVRTLDGCDVRCLTERCEGTARLRPSELCQICHYTDGENVGETFVTHTAAEGTPWTSIAGSLRASQAGSRDGSHAPSREQSPPRAEQG